MTTSQNQLDHHALLRIRHTELQRAHAELNHFSMSVDTHGSSYEKVSQQLKESQASLAERDIQVETLKAEVASLSESIRLGKSVKSRKEDLVVADKKNATLRDQQYRESLRDFSSQLKQTRKKLKNSEAYAELRERKYETELKARAKRIDKLQATIKNLNKVRESERKDWEENMKKLRGKIISVEKMHSLAKSKLQKCSRHAESAKTRADVLEKQVEKRNFMLEKSADLLRREQERNTALQVEMKRMAASFDERIARVTSSFVEILKEEREWRAKAEDGVKKLNNAVESKAGWLDVMSMLVTPPLHLTHTAVAIEAALKE